MSLRNGKAVEAVIVFLLFNLVLWLSAGNNAYAAADDGGWGYNCADGPPFLWGELPDEYSGKKFPLCTNLFNKMAEQSPINISHSNTVIGDLPPLTLHYDNPVALEVENKLGHRLQAIPEGESSITIGAIECHLEEFHFHTPSEHWVEGQVFPLEIHFVHKCSDDSLAVIGSLVEIGMANEEFDRILELLRNGNVDEKNETAHLDDFVLDDILPESLKTYRYEGSLTTPPCTEGVRWMVLTNPIEMSKEQIDDYNAVFLGAEKTPVGNARPIQTLNDRMIVIVDSENPVVTFPDDPGLIVKKGDIVEITWSGFTGNEVKVHLYAGTKYIMRVTDNPTTANDGLVGWTVPQDLKSSSKYRIRVKSTTDSSQSVFSEYTFTIE
jgi:carbonic anhydrase